MNDTSWNGDIRGFSLRQPHASLVAFGSKVIETRSWRTRWRGTLLIHASSAKIARDDAEYIRMSESFQQGLLGNDPDDLPLGAIVAVATLLDVIEIPEGIPCPGKLLGEGIVVRGTKLPPDGNECDFGDYTPGRFAWVLGAIRKVDPVPCSGARGLWRASPELCREVRARLMSPLSPKSALLSEFQRDWANAGRKRRDR